MITPTRALQAIAVAGLLAAALAENLRGNGSTDEVDGTRILKAKKAKVVAPPAVKAVDPPNHAVCYEIAASWWAPREEDKTRAAITAMDTDCDVFTNNAEACNNKSLRPAVDGQGNPYTDAQKNAACTMVGAHSKRCIGNPCNSYNLGTCTIQDTAGQCVWFAKDSKEFAVYQKWRTNNGLDPVAGFGCYRNPCNQPGLDQTIKTNECAARSMPEKNGWQCTWCAGVVNGKADSVLFGKGMGCQLTTPTTKAACAPVSNSAVAKASVMQAVADNNCQCSTDYTWCQKDVDDARTPLVPRYTTPG
jgi:hypothetical protein